MPDFVADEKALSEWEARGLTRVSTQSIRKLMSLLSEELHQRESAEGLFWKVTLSGA